jgi:hypothetical protein
MILQFAARSFGKIPGASLAPPWVKTGFGGLTAAAGFSFGTFTGYHMFGSTYGAGLSPLYGFATLNPVSGIPIGLAEVGHYLSNSAYQRQMSKKQSSFASARIDDRFGNMSQMRQLAGQRMRRDHSAAGRALGNEARYFHN